MRKYTRYTLLLAAVVGIVFVPFFSQAQIPFGGTITNVTYCPDQINSGVLVWLLIIDEPMLGPQPFIWFIGELPFMMYVVPHVGQNLIGMATPTTINCTLRGSPMIPSFPRGFPILFHGESL